MFLPTLLAFFLLNGLVVDLEALSGLQQTTLQSCQSTIVGLEETVAQLTTLVTSLEKSICQCQDCLLSLALHYTPGEEEPIVEETKEEGEEEEDGLEYTTDTLSLAPSHLPTLGNSDPENNVALHTEELEACIEVFLEEVEEDLEMNDLLPLKNASPLPVLAPVFPGFVPFTVSTGQHCSAEESP